MSTHSQGGRRIINAGATSGLVPTDNRFDQNFGSTQFARETMSRDTANLRQQPRAAQTNSNLRTSGATPKSTAGDGFAGLANLAQKNPTAVRDSIEEGNTPNVRRGGSQMGTRSNVNIKDSQSLIGSSGEMRGNPSQQNLRATNVGDSTAALGRNPTEVEGLFEWLCEEYYRRNGIYLSGSLERKDNDRLFDFWKNNISTSNKALIAQKKQEEKLDRMMAKDEEMFELSQTNPNAFRRLQSDREAKEQSKLEQREREMNIQSRVPTNCRYHTKKPDPTGKCTTCQRVSQRSSRPGSAAVARRNNSAVPHVRTENDQKLDQFKDLYELDVIFTINSKIRLIHESEQKDKFDNEIMYQQRWEKAQQKETSEAVDSMLQLYFLSHLKPADVMAKEAEQKKAKEAEQKKISPSKMAAGPPGSLETGAKKPVRPKTAGMRPPIKPTQPRQPVAQDPNAKKISIKEMMQNPIKKQQWVDYDLSELPQEDVGRYRFFVKLFKLVREDEEYGKVQTNDARKVKAVLQKQRRVFESTEKNGDYQIDEFFSLKGFIKRLRLHQKYINKSATKKVQDLRLYYTELLQQKRQVNLVDWIPRHENEPQDGHSAICKDMNDKAEAAYLKEEELKRQEAQAKIKLTEQQKKAEKDQKEADRQKYFDNLAKPKDKWKVGKKLMELKAKFPHDRVLERMIQAEFASNQTFRYPDEYDKHNQGEESKMKGVSSDYKGWTNGGKIDYDKGTLDYEKFKLGDKTQLNSKQSQDVALNRQQLQFEKDLIIEAKEYTIEASKRLKQASGERKTVRSSLKDIYARFRVKHPQVIEKQFKLKKAEYKPEEKERYEKQGIELPDDGNPTNFDNNKDYPESFRRYFFRLIKTLNGKTSGVANATVYKRSRKLPTTFMVAGKAGSTHNKKIMATAAFARNQAAKTVATRSRVFYRDDFQVQMPQIFMTNDDQINCKFEPVSGSLNPYFDNGTLPQEHKITRETEKDFNEKLGENMSKLHPEIFKKGKLQKAKRLHREGQTDACLGELMKAFKFESLRRHFDPNGFVKYQAALVAKKKREEEAKAAKDRLKAKKKLLASKSPGKGGAADEDDDFMEGLQIDQMKEAPEAVQKDMPAEVIDQKARSKEFAVQREAWDLIKEIEDKEIQTKKDVRRLEKQRQALILKKRQVPGESIDPDDGNTAKVMFKTIMCPLVRSCPNDLGARWPMSSAKTTTQLGAKCPYAHHPMELVFPQTVKTKISAIQKMKRELLNQESAQDKADGDKKPQTFFKPTGRISDCKGGCMAAQKCNMCKYRTAAGLFITDLDPIEEVKHHKIAQDIHDKMAKKVYQNMLNNESEETKVYMSKMKELKEELKQKMKEINEELDVDVDEQFCMKFGLLKKASVLAYYGRDKDAKKEIAKAAEIVQKQRQIDQERQKAIQTRWQFKLGLGTGEFELPERANIKKKHPSQITEEDLAEVEFGDGVTMATIRLYIEKVSPFMHGNYNKNVFLDGCIEDLYLDCEGKKMKNHGHIEKMKKHIEGLEEIAEIAEQFGEEGVEENMLEDEGHGIKFKPRKTKMCKDQLEKGKCHKGKTCKLAHNPLQLELVPVTKKIANLKGVVASQSRQLSSNQTIDAWIPPNKHIAVDKACFEPYIDTSEQVADEEGNDDKPKSIFEREDLFKDPLDDKD